MLASLPPKWLAERNVLFGAAFSAIGMAAGGMLAGTAMPVGVLLAALGPLALGTVYMPRKDLAARALVTSATGLPIGLVAASFLELAAWPVVGTAALVVGPGLASGYSCFYLAESKDGSMDSISVPSTPLCRLLDSVGLWAPWAPWAHPAFRGCFKLFFWYTCLGALPAAATLYGGYKVWLTLVLIWQYSLYLSLAAMSFGFFATSLSTMVPMEYKGYVARLLPTATRWGHWSLNNYVSHVMWIYAFYAFIPICAFLMWYKWKYGVNSSPFKAPDQQAGALYAGQRAFWQT